MLLPLGILGVAAIADLGAILSGLRLFSTIAMADMVTGMIVGTLAWCGLLIDLLTTAPGSVARAVLTVVCVSFGATIVLFTLVWSVESDAGRSNAGVFFIELLALGCGGVAVWLARALSVGRGLPKRLEQLPPPAERVTSAVAVRRAIANRWRPAGGSDDPEATIAIFGYARGRAPVRGN
jgi:hypothetical protein